MMVDRRVPFTQYLLPDGRQVPVYTEVEKEVAEKAWAILCAGYKFECEMLTTGDVSFTIVDPRQGEDVAIRVCPNDESVPSVVDDLIQSFEIPKSKRRRGA